MANNSPFRWTGGIPCSGPHSQQYTGGRVAQRLGDERIEVISLITGASKIYVDPDRERISYWILGHQYLVGCIGPGSGPT